MNPVQPGRLAPDSEDIIHAKADLLKDIRSYTAEEIKSAVQYFVEIIMDDIWCEHKPRSTKHTESVGPLLPTPESFRWTPFTDPDEKKLFSVTAVPSIEGIGKCLFNAWPISRIWLAILLYTRITGKNRSIR